MRTLSAHTGADFEAGRTGRPRGEQPPIGAEPPSPLGRENDERRAHSPTRARTTTADVEQPGPSATAGSPVRSSPRHHAAASPRDARAQQRTESREAEDNLRAELRKPWRGQAEKLKPAQKAVLACFEERGVEVKELEGGEMISTAQTRYWVKWDSESTAKTTKTLNITRLFEAVLKSRHAPMETKLELCNQLNNAAARAFLQKHAASSSVPATDQPEADALQAKRKQAKTDGDAHAKEDDRQRQITEFAKREVCAAVRDPFSTCLFYCTCPFLHMPFLYLML